MEVKADFNFVANILQSPVHPVLGGSGTRRGYRIAGYRYPERHLEVSLGIYIGLSGYLYT